MATAFRDTILGKILGGVGKVVLPVVSSIPVIGGMISAGVNAVGGLVGNIGAPQNQGASLSAIAANSQSLLGAAGADPVKYNQYMQLLQAGYSQEQALQASGLSVSPYGGITGGGTINPVLLWGGVLVGGFVILKALKIIK